MDDPASQIFIVVISGIVVNLVLQILTIAGSYKLVAWRLKSNEDAIGEVKDDNKEHWKITSRSEKKIANIEGWRDTLQE